MTLRTAISERAEIDLAHTYRWYLDSAGEPVAERFIKAFDHAASRLASHPGLGRKRRFRSLLLAGIRSFRVARPFDRQLIFYRVSQEQLLIERVVHGSRDLPRRLMEFPMEPGGW